MKIKHLVLSLLAATGLAQAGEATPATVTENNSSYGRFYSCMTLGDDAPEYKKQLLAKTGTLFSAEVGVGYWAIDNQGDGYCSDNYIAKLYATVDQRLIENSVHGGTWLHFCGMGSWGLEDDSAATHFYDGGFGTATWTNTDLFGPHNFYICDLTLKQYFNNKRGLISAGVIFGSQYFDRISHARFVNDAFEKSNVLPLIWQAPGIVVQYEFDQDNFGTLALLGTGVPGGQNPFNFDNTTGHAIIAEWGHEFAEDKGTWRIAPFFTHEKGPHYSGRDTYRTAYGIMTGVEYQINDKAKVYGRLGCASSNYTRVQQEAMVGATLRVVPSRPDDYLGMGFGIYKGSDEGNDRVNKYEKVLEFTYNIQLNKYFTLAPYYQLYIDPAYRDTNTVSATGVQAHFAF